MKQPVMHMIRSILEAPAVAASGDRAGATCAATGEDDGLVTVKVT